MKVLYAIALPLCVGPALGLAAKKGFSTKPAVASKKATLSGSAKRLLAEHDGDLDAAQGARFQGYLEKLREKDPDLFLEVTKARSTDGGASASGREALCAMTWDVIADYLPVMGGSDAELDRRMAAIAERAGTGRCLDVGCGDGSLVPHLGRAGVDLSGYVGIELSGKMVKAAKKRHPKRTFLKSAFFDFAAAADRAGEFDAVVFAGSLQFFPDVSEVLRACDAVLAPGGLVVISHVRGNDFIREEKRGNPALIHDMPTADDLANVAGFDLAHVGDALDDFYLAVLQNRR